MPSVLAAQPILLLEDEPLIALEVAEAFKSVGADVVVTFSLDQALKVISTRRWEGAVLDYRLDQTDCSCICDWLDEQRVPFVIYTGLGEIPGQWRNGVHVLKPAEPSDLVRIIEQLADPARCIAI